MSWQRDSGELDQPLELTDSDTQQEMEEEDGGEEEEEEEEVVCFGLGEDDSDEVTEDEADVGVAIGPPVGVVATPLGTDAVFGAGVGEAATSSSSSRHEEDKKDVGRGNRDVGRAAIAAASGTDNRTVYSLMQELDQERSVLMKEIESEEQHRLWFFRQLEVITNKLDTLPLTNTYNLQTDMARRQLEYEAQQVQGAMTDKLGSAEQSSQRQEARLRRIRSIEADMMQLQRQQHLIQRAAAVVYRDASTNTTLNRNLFTAVSGQESGGYTCERSVAKAADGRYLATVAVQTADVTLIPEEGHAGVASAPVPLNTEVSSAMYHGAWPIHKDMSHVGHSGAGMTGEVGSVMSFTSTNTHSSSNSHTSSLPPTTTAAATAGSSASSKQSPQQLGTKVEMVYSLLSMLGTHDKDDMSRTLLAMSSSQDSCIAMRQSGCLPLLIQLLHGSDKDSGLLGNTRGSAAARARASAALHNIVHSNPDDVKRGRREARTLRLLEQIRAHCDQQRGETVDEGEEEGAGSKSADIDHHPGPAIAALMKLSFDEDYRHAICSLGGLQAMAELLEVDHTVHGNTAENYSVTVRRYACMALTNLTFGDGKNKALLCSMRPAMEALVAQLHSPNEDLCQGAASVLRNLSWRADLASKKTLREVGAVRTLMESAMVVKKETTLKSILSALWNLSSHCSENKAQICAVPGALEFLVSLLTYKSAGKTHAIVENGGGILRNVSSQVAVREDYRRILRHKGCLQLLLAQLRSTSLTIVSNACGTLWNLSARCAEDQELLREMGAVAMLRNLVHSKHRMIAMGSSAALRNLLSSSSGKGGDSDRVSGAGARPTLSARKQRALEEELQAQNLSETCDNVESPRDSPTDRNVDGDGRRFVYQYDSALKSDDDPRRVLHRRHANTRCGSSDSAMDGGGGRVRSPQRVPRASSQDSVTSTHSDISHDRSRVHHMLGKSTHLLHRRQGGSLERQKERSALHRVSSDHACSSLEQQDARGEVAGQSSRIVRYMQEVAMLAGVGGDLSSNPADLPDSQGDQSCPAFPHQASSSQSRVPTVPTSAHQRLYEHLVKKNASVNLGYDRGDDSDSSEQPVNYSLKYQDSPPTMYPQSSMVPLSVPPPVQATPLQSHPSSRTVPPHTHPASVRAGSSQAGVFQGSGVAKYPNPATRHITPTSLVPHRFPVPHAFPSPSHPQSQPPQSGFQGQHKGQGSSGQYGGAYAETDVDSMDEQPTDFSLRYAEDQSDDQDQPINYSLRYQSDPDPDCVECKYEEARRTNERLEQSANDDQVLTFCTEGTPFLSTATSLTDLTGGKQGGESEDKNNKDTTTTTAAAAVGREAGKDEEDEEEEGDELHNYSARYGECQDTPGNSSCGHTSSTIRPVPACSHQGYGSAPCPPSQPAAPQSFHAEDDSLPPDQIKTYCEEGTPVCFSRVSSLSSLHSSEARDVDQGRPIMLQSIDEAEKGEMATSVIENKGAISVKTVLVDRDHRRNRAGEAEKEGKTVTFDETHQVEETPLMFSRCSSLGSLSSFDTQSVHSSLVSEHSRRASQVVSPSELPDSPSETMPPSPTRVQSPPARSFKPVAMDLVGESSAPAAGGVGLKGGHGDDKVAWQGGEGERQVDKQTAKLLDIFHSTVPHAQPHPQDAVSISGKSEVPVVYAVEGTPPVFSETSSLSALTLDGEGSKVASPPQAAAETEPKDDSESADVTLCDTQDVTLVKDEKDSSMSEVSEGEEDILAQCISAAMPAPTPSSRKLRKSSSDNTIKKKSALPKPEPSGAKSRLPTKVTSPVSSTPLSKAPKPSPASKSVKAAKPDPVNKKGSASPGGGRQSGSAAKPPRPAQTKPPQNAGTRRQPAARQSLTDDDYAADTLQTFATEGTPLNFSAATSLSDLSGVTEAVGKVQSPPSCPKSPEDCKSDTSSLCEETEQQLLNDMIQSAMPKSRTARRLDVERTVVGRRQPSGSKAAPRTVATKKEDVKRSAQSQSAVQARPVITMEVPFVSSAADTTQTYATEGTPNNFSAATSLSDLTVDSDSGGSRGGRVSAGRSPVKASGAHQAAGRHVAMGDGMFSEGMDSPRVYVVEGTPTSFSRNDSLSSIEILDDKGEGAFMSDSPLATFPHASERHVIGQSSEDSSVKSEKQQCSAQRAGNKDETRKFQVEDTPISFSRNSSLSSLASGGRAREPQPEEEPQISRTSSMGSLSAESAGFDPTPSEQALLDQCINAAMPKRRASRGDDRSRRHSRGTKNEGRALQEGGSLKNSALEIRAEFDSVDLGEPVPITQGKALERGEKLMTRSCSDALDMESDDGGRPSRFSSWRKHRQMSCDGMKTRDTHSKGMRSHSQDNFLKTQKDISNRITQSSGESSASSSNSASHYTASCSTSVIHVDTASTTDNRLTEQNHSPPHADGALITSATDSSSSGEKADSEKSVGEETAPGPASHFPTGHGDLHDDEEEGEGSCDLDRTVVEVRKGLQKLMERESLDEGDLGCQQDLHVNPALYEDGLEEKLCFGSGHTSFEVEEGHRESENTSFEQEISAEDERLLQENASLIVSEIVTKRDMTGSALEEDMLIENETLSLVSNDYTSDTASEVSVSWSTNSEKLSERSCSQASQVDTASGGSKGVKGEGKLTGKKTADTDDGKGMKGRRKPLYNKPSPSSLKTAPRIDPSKSRPTSGSGANSRPNSAGGSNSRPSSAGGTNSRPNSAGGVNSRPNSGGGSSIRTLGGAVGNARSPGGAGRGSAPQKKTSPRTQVGQTKSNLPGPRTPQGSQKPSPSTASGKTPPAKTSTAKTASTVSPRQLGSGIPRSPAKGGNAPPSRLPSATSHGKDAVERPKPPTKQATFVKDSNPPSKDANSVRLRARSASRGRSQPDRRSSGGAAGTSQRNSVGSPPEAWSKALDSFNFVVDKSKEGGSIPPYKQPQLQRNSKEAAPAVRRTSATTTAAKQQQQRPSNIARPQQSSSSPRTSKPAAGTASGPKAGASGKSNLPARTNLNKSGSASSLKTGSGSSLAKTSSGSSLNKTNSGSSLNKATTGNRKPTGVTTPAREEMKKSESNSSLRRASEGSRPSTPNGRRPSNPSKIPDRTGPGGGKKQVSSKIASMWKKEEGVERSASMEEPALNTSSFKLRAKSSSLPTSARNISISSLTFVKKSSSAASHSSGDECSGSSTEIIPRSSTFDKFPSDQSRAAWRSGEDAGGDDPVTSSEEGMLELCDPSAEESEGGEVNLDEAYIHHDPTDEETATACSNDSLEDAAASDDHLSVTNSTIDSSTWRRKQRPSKEGDVTLQLPNADETCRSMCSFLTADESQNESLARPAETSVWQRCGDDSAVSEVSFAADASTTSKKTKTKKSVAKSIKSTFAGLKLFGSKQSKDQTKGDKSKKSPVDPPSSKAVTASTGTSTEALAISVPSSKPSTSAIVAPVAPFNYSPPASASVVVTTSAPTLSVGQASGRDSVADSSGDGNAGKKGPGVNKHFTKTEMLLARRRQNFLNSSRQDEGEGEGGQRGCMVTTV